MIFIYYLFIYMWTCILNHIKQQEIHTWHTCTIAIVHLVYLIKIPPSHIFGVVTSLVTSRVVGYTVTLTWLVVSCVVYVRHQTFSSIHIFQYIVNVNATIPHVVPHTEDMMTSSVVLTLLCPSLLSWSTICPAYTALLTAPVSSSPIGPPPCCRNV